jgi:sarcosine oxidase subunit gamma
MIPRAPVGAHLAPGRHGRPDGAAGVTVMERAALASASLALRGGHAAPLAERLRAAHGLGLPHRPGRSANGPVALVWTSPGQWLAMDESRQGLDRFGFARDLAAAVGETASVTDLTGGRAVLRLSGPAAVETLRKLVPIDVDEEAFAPDAAAMTLAGHIGVTLWRLPGAAPAYEIACYRSFGEALADAVLEAAAEFGCEVLPPR